MRLILALIVVFVLAACEATTAPPAPVTLDAPLVPVATSMAPAGTPPTPDRTARTLVPTNTLFVAPVATASPTAGPTDEPPPTDDPDQVVVTLSPLVITDVEPPVHIQLPKGWTVASDAIIMPELDELGVVPFGYYRGPITGGTGVITVLYGFPNLVSGIGGGSANVFTDALRLLLFAIIEPECEYSFDEERPFRMGEITARGTYYAADECPDGLPSLKGWFAAFNVEGLNVAVYAYVEPLEAYDGPGRAELAAVFDSVTVDLSLLATETPTP
ncbi:MAG: hypothetical protein IT298_16380 [Chloroflexi bacterium]|nr:hypothetical protein [Chloroflexota bacterium]MBV6438013.1 hypothetical protein [Anaerolineae bacterium]MDL1915267.1 hypothetical protein [Anaerolineae bacterium CFX4]MCC6567339.1 hypothetical protein [Chloroflexota bacterium]MCO6445454.1 hypothetical protein [Anaerolineae bacterium]